MITLKKLAYEVMRLEMGEFINNDDSQLSENYVILLCRQAINKLIAPAIYQKVNEDDRSGLQLMTAMYTVTVQGDNPTKFIELPEFYVNLPFNKGLHGVALVDDPTNFLIPRLNPSVSRGLPCADLDPNTYSYWTIGYKIYLDETYDFNKALIYLLVGAPDDIGVDSPLPIYPEMQWDVIALVRQMISVQKPIQEKLMDPNTENGQTVRR